jgi:hypothetical protein
VGDLVCRQVSGVRTGYLLTPQCLYETTFYDKKVVVASRFLDRPMQGVVIVLVVVLVLVIERAATSSRTTTSTSTSTNRIAS